MSTIFFEIIGYSGGIILASYTWPQIHRIYVTKSSLDISMPSLFLYMFGITLLLVYNIHIDKPALYIPGFIELSNIIILIGMKLVYDPPPDPICTGMVTYGSAYSNTERTGILS